MSIAPQPTTEVPAPTELVALARSRAPDDRERLLRGIARLCDAAPEASRATPVLGEVFMILARQAERDIRLALSQCLAGADWAPPALINMLALDEIEIARPVIALSPVLDDAGLMRVLIEATIEHQIEVARRPQLSALVAEAVIDRGEPAVVTALAGNRTAHIGPKGMDRLVDQSRRVAALRAPLIRHPRLQAAQAMQLHQWVGQALREAIGERFRVDDALLSVSIDQAVAWSMTPRPAPVAEPLDREEGERRLATKLHAAGQLRPGFLIRAVRERRLVLFEHALACLSGFPLAQVRAAVLQPTPDALFLACTAVGIDRAVFPPLVAEIRNLTGGSPGAGVGAGWAAASVSPAGAAREFRTLMGVAA